MNPLLYHIYTHPDRQCNFYVTLFVAGVIIAAFTIISKHVGCFVSVLKMVVLPGFPHAIRICGQRESASECQEKKWNPRSKGCSGYDSGTS
jgi:hypothetical protein